MDKIVATLDKGTTCSAWNYSGQRMAAGSADGNVAIYDLRNPDASTFHCTSRFKVREARILKIVWVPPEYGDAVACICSDGTLSLWEEVVEDNDVLKWKTCKTFGGLSSQVLDVRFGGAPNLKLVAAFSDGQVKIFELLDPFELGNWQLQAEFQNVIESTSKFARPSCLSASISWDLQRHDYARSSFVMGFNSDVPQLNSPKVWEFDQDHQRWLPVAELALPEERADQVLAVAWSPNIGRGRDCAQLYGILSVISSDGRPKTFFLHPLRPFEIIAVATLKGISIWHVGLNPNVDGRLSVERVALLSGHEGEVWQMEWDVSGMTLATVGSDGVARLWQSNLNGIWEERAMLEPRD